MPAKALSHTRVDGKEYYDHSPSLKHIESMMSCSETRLDSFGQAEGKPEQAARVSMISREVGISSYDPRHGSPHTDPSATRLSKSLATKQSHVGTYQTI
jgi:hypothetical protein